MFTVPETSTVFGPPSKAPASLAFSDSPYAPFSKGDKLGKAADWAADPAKDGKDQKRTQGRGFRDPYHAYGASSTTFFTNDDSDSSWSFSVVDSNAKTAPKPKQQNAVLKARTGGRQNQQQGPGASAGQNQRQPRFQQPQQFGGRDNRGGFRRQGNWANDKSKNREPSIPIEPSWTLVQSNNFSELSKLSYDVSMDAKVLGEYGYVAAFDKSLDKGGAAPAKRLRPVDSTVYNVTTSDDPIIQKFAQQGLGKVYATDTVLAVLMCATKSNNPWDIIINKTPEGIFLDKREGGPLDFLTVDENSYAPPSDTSETRIDTTAALGIEATYINQNFAANVVLPDSRVELKEANPFADASDSDLLAKGYLYKEFNLEADAEKPAIPLIVRTEVDAAVTQPDGDQSFVLVRALNEYGGAKPLEWKDRFMNHRGAIVAAEMKKNLNKLSQWTIEALLSGAKALKIGFVSRMNAKDKTQHEIIGVLSREPTQFASQLNLQLSNGWGIVKSIVNISSSLDDGKYVLLRDPNVTALRIYRA